MDVNHEIKLLQKHIRRLGTKNSDGQYVVTYGVIFADDICQNVFEALVGTLRSAKKRKIVRYKPQLLLQGVSDDVDIVLLKGNEEESSADANDNNAENTNSAAT